VAAAGSRRPEGRGKQLFMIAITSTVDPDAGRLEGDTEA
jgi:hypothetical protein